jgi:hypothetical protein
MCFSGAGPPLPPGRSSQRESGCPTFRGFREVGVDAAGGYGGWAASRTSAAEAVLTFPVFIAALEALRHPKSESSWKIPTGLFFLMVR